MKSSPVVSERIGDLIPIVTRVIRHRFPRVPDDRIRDAVSFAVERCLKALQTGAEKTTGEVFCWLRTAAANEVLNELRSSSRYVDAEKASHVFEHLTDGHQADLLASRRILLELLVARLGSATAETLWLHEIEQCPPRDIAIIQNISISSVKARITRSRKILRQYWRWIS